MDGGGWQEAREERARAEKAEAERDEANAKYLATVDDLVETESERDQLRAEVERLKREHVQCDACEPIPFTNDHDADCAVAGADEEESEGRLRKSERTFGVVDVGVISIGADEEESE